MQAVYPQYDVAKTRPCDYIRIGDLSVRRRPKLFLQNPHFLVSMVLEPDLRTPDVRDHSDEEGTLS